MDVGGLVGHSATHEVSLYARDVSAVYVKLTNVFRLGKTSEEAQYYLAK